MPEIAEVARTVHFIRKHLVGKTIATCIAAHDENVYGKNKEGATTGAEFQKHMTGNKVIDAGQQGKYFWMIMAEPPHPVMHFGMSGWIDFKSEHTYYYRPKPGEKEQEWPPKFWKFHLETKPEKGKESETAAFKDMRRFARIRLLDCPGDKIREYSPLVDNGPDPVADKEKVTVEWLTEKCHSKKVPIKAMLLDQANISGIGNWVGDEIMYNAKMHPEQYANTLSDDQIKQLHKSIHHICGTAVGLLGDSGKFPEDWLFKHRWGKGKKDASKTLPNGEKIAFLTVGGRTSAVIPSVQKKTGPVAKEMDEAVIKDEDEEKPEKTAGKKRKVAEDDEDEEEEEVKPAKKVGGKKTKKEEEEVKPSKAAAKKGKKNEQPVVNGDVPKTNGTTAKKGRGPMRVKAEEKPEEGRRRSGRQSRG
jgi:formamidopyrimidine-DNA glycosylase